MVKHLVLSGLLFVACSVASASERFSFGFGGSTYYNDGHYVTRLVTVCVEPARTSLFLVQPATIEKLEVNGIVTEIKHPAKYEERICPARYENHYETVWIPDYRVYYSEPSFRFGFGWNEHRRH